MKSELVVEKFADLIIERMEQMKETKWEKGWIGTTFGEMPMNIRGREYNGTNAFLLFLLASMKDWKYPLFATFHQIKELGGSINKGAESFPVLYWKIVYKTKDGEKIDSLDGLSREERKACTYYPVLRSYNVFNISQTNLEEVAPKVIEKLKAKFHIEEPPKDTLGMYENADIDDMLTYQKWLCPIHYQNPSNEAYYRPSKDEIVVPMKTQFYDGTSEEKKYISGMRFYDVLLHEMAHSTGHDSRLARGKGNPFGSKEYAKEELVAELTAAIIGQTLGFDPKIMDNNACYLDSWIKTMKKEPKFIVSVLADVNKAAQMILEVVNNEHKVLVETEEES